jgi:tetratricopeptide (TPR) repeat protein
MMFGGSRPPLRYRKTRTDFDRRPVDHRRFDLRPVRPPRSPDGSASGFGRRSYRRAYAYRSSTRNRPSMRECLQRNPNDLGTPRIAIGMLRFESGQFAEAEQMLMDAFLQAPAHPQASYLLASSLLNQGKLDDTVEVLRASLSIHPQSVPNLVLLGQVQLQQKQPAEAKESFLAASRFAPDYANAWFGLATACVQLGQQEEAATHRATFQQLQRQQLRAESSRPEITTTKGRQNKTWPQLMRRWAVLSGAERRSGGRTSLAIGTAAGRRQPPGAHRLGSALRKPAPSETGARLSVAAARQPAGAGRGVLDVDGPVACPAGRLPASR